jgi:hypothetical protein
LCLSRGNLLRENIYFLVEIWTMMLQEKLKKDSIKKSCKNSLKYYVFV